MSNIAFLRKDDAEAAANQERAAKILEEIAAMIRANKCNGMVVVAFERGAGKGPDVEMTVQRYYLSGGVGDMLTLMGLNKIVLDEMSEGSRITMDMQ